MEVKVCIRTPKGKADTALDDWKLRVIKNTLFKKSKVKEEYTNKANDKLYWVIQTDARGYLRIVKSVSNYSSIVSGVFENKHVRKGIKKMADSPEDYEQLKTMIKDGTRVSILKQATAQELVEANKTYWQRIKETFKKRTPKD